MATLTELIALDSNSQFVHDNSIYKSSEAFVDGSNRFFSPPTIKISKSANDSFHKVENGEAGRLDIIANKFYESPSLWWVIASANNIFNTFTEVTVNKILRIPDIIAVRRELNL